MAWAIKFDKATPEEKKIMINERDQAEYRREHGLDSQVILSDSEQLILDMKNEAFRIMENRPQTKEEQELTDYSRK